MHNYPAWRIWLVFVVLVFGLLLVSGLVLLARG